MATLRELKGRIGSVASSEKITGAMKMISSAKMHKAEGELRKLLPYREGVKTIISSLLSSDAQVSSPLTEERTDVKRVGVVVSGSDDGLCGAYNVNIYKGLLVHLGELRSRYGDAVEVVIYPIGKKLIKIVDKLCAADPAVTKTEMPGLDSKSTGEAVKALCSSLVNSFVDGELDRVDMIYMQFVSAGRQRLYSGVYLPVSPQELSGGEASGRPYLFEPDATTIFATVMPMYLLARLQEAFAQNRASEQAARVLAMQSANDNAQKLLEQLQLEYNKLRQQGITTELLDIVGGQIRD